MDNDLQVCFVNEDGVILQIIVVVGIAWGKRRRKRHMLHHLHLNEAWKRGNGDYIWHICLSISHKRMLCKIYIS